MNRRMESGDLLLASGSPRRRKLLERAGLNPTVKPARVDERPLEGEAAVAMVRRLAQRKARAALAETDRGEMVLAADTAVVDRGRILGKPEDEDHAVAMLMGLEGREHDVLTALALIERRSGEERVRVARSRLRMRNYTRSEAEAYVAGGSPLDKAGGYGIQDEGFRPVDMDDFEDCFTNVMGLPLCTLGAMLDDLGRRPGADLVEACMSYSPHSLTDLQGV